MTVPLPFLETASECSLPIEEYLQALVPVQTERRLAKNLTREIVCI